MPWTYGMAGSILLLGLYAPLLRSRTGYVLLILAWMILGVYGGPLKESALVAFTLVAQTVLYALHFLVFFDVLGRLRDDTQTAERMQPALV